MNVFSNPISLPEMVEEVEFDESQNTVRYGDVLFTTSSETPEEVGMSSVWLENTENTYLNSFCFGFRPVKKVNPYYLAYLLRSSGMRRKISFLAQGISRYNISKAKMMELEISIPNENEQSAIGTFFSTLDQHITLHQRKLDKLKSVKQAYLSEIFPAEGERVPKRRFPGFTDAWELRKLVEVARFRRGSFPQPYGNSEWYDGDGAMPFVQVADVTDEMNLVGDTKQKISRKAQPLSVFAEEGSVLVTLQGSIGRVAITQYGAFIDRTVLIFEKFNLPVDNLFWAYIIKQKFIEEAKCAPGGTIKTITKEVLSDFDIKLPSHPEQETIGTFFSSLDRHITLHQRKSI